ncbi:CsbD family protein [Variovorax sp. Root411]|uniref:CsbD family protein n=1 Tax=Variovorax sp. Root411 TaxID=1736530 RepID=UPI0006FCDAA5|nr:CsbD family protein [Variovorax sp. Root411]KQW63647.1 general stress protein CsbD [Variovorax sp. Root411]
MNKDQLAGRAEEAKGKLKEVAGKAVGSQKLESKGIAEQAAGKVQKTYGDVKERAKDAIKSGANKL